MALIALLGESGSGKTTLINQLIGLYPNRFKKVATYTSRQSRSGEVNGIHYHFRTSNYFEKNSNLVLLKRVTKGDYYATRKEDLQSETHTLVIALRPEGVNNLVKLGTKNLTVVSISITEELKTERMHRRGDSEDLIHERLESDISDRRELQLHETPIIHVNAADSIEAILKEILRSTHI